MFKQINSNNPENLIEKIHKKKQLEEWRKVTVGATGHRSDRMGGYHNSLGGYDRNHYIAIELRKSTLEIIEDLIVNQGMSRFISGGALGFDTLFFWCVNHLKAKYPHIENVLAIPFINQWVAWVDTLPLAVEWYHKMVAKADLVIDVARQPEYETGEDRSLNPISLDDFTKQKMFKRNYYMVDQSRYLIAFFNGESRSGTANCLKYAQRGVITRPSIVRIDPRFGFKPNYY
jgi:uncharacterized phage-like protein YoqJ